MSSIQAGDVVVCVNLTHEQGWKIRSIQKGKMYRVEAVSCDPDDGVAVVTLHGVVADTELGWFAAYRFRKVQKATPDFIAQIKACRPKQRDRVSS